MKHFFITLLLMAIVSYISSTVSAATYYIAPDKDLDGSNPNIEGIDTNPGTLQQPWKTFTRAWNDLFPGDVLILIDGIYTQGMWPNKRDGIAGSPITIKAQNDGKAIIDGESKRRPVVLKGTENGWSVGNYYTMEGIVARNAGTTYFENGNSDGGSVITVYGNHNILKRVSAYNADTDENSMVIGLLNVGPADSGGSYNLLEDCIAAGSGRKMINVYKGTANIVRRCTTYWTEFYGRNSCQDWPNGTNFQAYNSSNIISENIIAMGPVGKWSTAIFANSDNSTAVNNKILGTIVINAGMTWGGNEINWFPWGTETRPTPTSCSVTQVIDFENWTRHRTGTRAYGQGTATFNNNEYRDFLAYNNASFGFSGESGSSLNHGTLIKNGLCSNCRDKGKQIEGLGEASVDNNTYIQGTNYQGEGARLQNKYINGVLTNESLWPWPMEQRVQDELCIQLTETLSPLVNYNPQTDAIPQVQLQYVPGYATGACVPMNKRYDFIDWSGTDIPTPTPTTDPTQPTPTPTRAPTTAVTPITLPGAGIISSFTVASSRSYQAVADGLIAGSSQYTDRSFTFSSIPTHLLNQTYIKTANDDKGSGGDTFLTLTLSQPATVYVAHDDRITTKPNWLSEFTDSEMNLVSGGGTFSLLSRTYPAGTVILGGNAGGSNSMYSVIVVPQDGTKPGDTDGDGDIDIFDYNAVLGNMGTVTGATRSGGDLDGDGDVDIFDYNEVIGNFGR